MYCSQTKTENVRVIFQTLDYSFSIIFKTVLQHCLINITAALCNYFL
jgi:hypothetical protein